MSDVAKWLILAAFAVSGIAVILGFPIMEYALDFDTYLSGITTIVTYAGNAFRFGRGLINNLFSPWARTALSVLMTWLVGKWLMTYSLKIAIWIYHYMFK